MKQEFLMPSNVYHYSKSFAGHEIRHQYYSDIEEAIMDAPADGTILLFDPVYLAGVSATALEKSKYLNLVNQHFSPLGYLEIDLTMDFDNQNKASALLQLWTGDESSNIQSVSSIDPVALSGGDLVYAFVIPSASKLNKSPKGFLQMQLLHSRPTFIIQNGDTGNIILVTVIRFDYLVAGLSANNKDPQVLNITLRFQAIGGTVDFVGETFTQTFEPLTTFTGALSEFEPTVIMLPVKLFYGDLDTTLTINPQ